MNKHRVTWIDISKGIGIILVVLGHNTIPEKMESWIFSFHMPLFFFLSGYLFNKFKYTSLQSLLIKQSKSLLIPYFVFSIFSFLFWYFIKNNVGQSSDINPIDPLIGIFYSIGVNPWLTFNPPLWFLTCLFVVEVLFYIFTKNRKTKWIISLLIIFSILGYLNSLYNLYRLPWSIDIALTALVFFGVGNLFKQQNFKIKFKYITNIIIIISAVSINFLFTKVKIDMNYNFYGEYFNFYIAAFSGILATLIFAQTIPSFKLLIYLGQNSLTIFALHWIAKPFVIKLLSIGNLYQESSFFANVLLTILQIIVLIPVCYFLNKYFPFLLGKQRISTLKTKNVNNNIFINN